MCTICKIRVPPCKITVPLLVRFNSSPLVRLQFPSPAHLYRSAAATSRLPSQSHTWPPRLGALHTLLCSDPACQRLKVRCTKVLLYWGHIISGEIRLHCIVGGLLGGSLGGEGGAGALTGQHGIRDSTYSALGARVEWSLVRIQPYKALLFLVKYRSCILLTFKAFICNPKLFVWMVVFVSPKRKSRHMTQKRHQRWM